MSKEAYVPHDDQYITREVFMHRPSYTLVYGHLAGSGDIITNHISDTYLQILDGEGLLSTQTMQVELQPGDHIRLAAGTKRQIIGNLSFFTEYVPGLIPAFVTLGNEQLPRQEQTILRKIERIKRQEKRSKSFQNIVDLIIEQQVEKLDDVLGFQYMLHKEKTL